MNPFIKHGAPCACVLIPTASSGFDNWLPFMWNIISIHSEATLLTEYSWNVLSWELNEIIQVSINARLLCVAATGCSGWEGEEETGRTWHFVHSVKCCISSGSSDVLIRSGWGRFYYEHRYEALLSHMSSALPARVCECVEQRGSKCVCVCSSLFSFIMMRVCWIPAGSWKLTLLAS